MLPKITIIWKKISSKSCWALNFWQKTQRVHKSMSPRSGARGSKNWDTWNIMMYWNGKLDYFQYSGLSGLVHTCRQNPRLSTDKLRILSVDCCGTNPTWSGTFCHASTPATCPWTIAELCLHTQVRDFVYKCVLNLRKIIAGCGAALHTRPRKRSNECTCALKHMAVKASRNVLKSL